jgi:hypothetical protein
MANPVGRPSKYNDEIQAQADSYLYGWQDVDALPSRVGLCCYIGIHKATSYEWEETYPKFSDTCKAIEALQERTALNKGITGEFNSQITKLVLANHGYSDKQAVDHTTNGESITRIERVIIDSPSDKNA